MLWSLSQCLRDSALPVQIEAASSLRYIIELDETKEPVLNVLPDILNEYFRIMKEIGLDEVGNEGCYASCWERRTLMAVVPVT